MAGTKIPVATRSFSEPTRVTIEASIDTIIELDLNMLDGEQFDSIDAVIAIDIDHREGTVTLTTARTHAAWKRGEANAGRGTRVFPRAAIEALYI